MRNKQITDEQLIENLKQSIGFSGKYNEFIENTGLTPASGSRNRELQLERCRKFANVGKEGMYYYHNGMKEFDEIASIKADETYGRLLELGIYEILDNTKSGMITAKISDLSCMFIANDNLGYARYHGEDIIKLLSNDDIKVVGNDTAPLPLEIEDFAMLKMKNCNRHVDKALKTMKDKKVILYQKYLMLTFETHYNEQNLAKNNKKYIISRRASEDQIRSYLNIAHDEIKNFTITEDNGEIRSKLESELSVHSGEWGKYISAIKKRMKKELNCMDYFYEYEIYWGDEAVREEKIYTLKEIKNKLNAKILQGSDSYSPTLRQWLLDKRYDKNFRIMIKELNKRDQEELDLMDKM